MNQSNVGSAHHLTKEVRAPLLKLRRNVTRSSTSHREGVEPEPKTLRISGDTSCHLVHSDAVLKGVIPWHERARGNGPVSCFGRRVNQAPCCPYISRNFQLSRRPRRPDTDVTGIVYKYPTGLPSLIAKLWCSTAAMATKSCPAGTSVTWPKS